MNGAQQFWSDAQTAVNRIPEPWRALVCAVIVVGLLAIIPGTKKFAVPAAVVITIAWLAKYFKQQGGA